MSSAHALGLVIFIIGIILFGFLAGCQMTVVNTGAGSAANTASPTTSPPITVPVQVGPGGIPSLPPLPGNVFMLPMPSQPVIVHPPAPVVVNPQMGPSDQFPAGMPPAVAAPQFGSSALQHGMFSQ